MASAVAHGYRHLHFFIYYIMLFTNRLYPILLGALLMLCACGGDDDSYSGGGDSPTPSTEDIKFNITQEAISAPSNGGTYGNITVSTTGSSLSAQSDNQDWITVSMTKQSVRVGVLTIMVAPNTGESRQGTVSIISGSASKKIIITQEAAPVEEKDPKEMTEQSVYVPAGYTMVWNDEFNTGDVPGSGWWYETGRGSNGWGNNEEQYYVSASSGSNVGFCKDGYMNIVCRKNGSRIESIRMNTTDAWQYGYFEARLKLPAGKGTWPAFWMMPKNFTTWPGDGEIDIMEEVGYDANRILSTIHCNKYNNSGTSIESGSKYVSTSQTEYHIYALEWTSGYMTFFVDGQKILTYNNDGTGWNAWPFDAPFYIKLNLAWGGNWGGAHGTDESFLPATYKIDYVRVYQKK